MGIGDGFCIFVSSINRICVVGNNNWGQLGLGNTAPITSIKKHKFPANDNGPIEFIQAICGDNHSILLCSFVSFFCQKICQNFLILKKKIQKMTEFL